MFNECIIILNKKKIKAIIIIINNYATNGGPPLANLLFIFPFILFIYLFFDF